jgi:hypothetical protein
MSDRGEHPNGKYWIELATRPSGKERSTETLAAYYAPLVSHLWRYGTRWKIHRGNLYREMKPEDWKEREKEPAFWMSRVKRLSRGPAEGK